MRLRRRVKDVDRLKDEGNTAFRAGNMEEAVAKYGEALERIGESEDEGKGGYIRAMLLSNRATTFLKMGKDEDALTDADASIELNPTTFKVYRTRARANLHLEKYEAAVGDFKSAIEYAENEGSDSDVRALRSELKKAEVDLKRSKTKDYYKILGVSKESTEVEIKKAYRRESLKHHPDKGGDEEKFKLVVEAHSILSDPAKRQRYDMGEDDEDMFEGGVNPMEFADIFTHFQTGGFPGFQFRSNGHGHGGGYGGGWIWRWIRRRVRWRVLVCCVTVLAAVDTSVGINVDVDVWRLLPHCPAVDGQPSLACGWVYLCPTHPVTEMHILQLNAAEHKIESLTVFRAGNAEVVRSFDLSLKSGDYEIEITGSRTTSHRTQNTGFQPQHSEAMRKLLVRKQALEAEKQIREQENDIHLTYYQHRSSDGLLGAELNQFLQTFVAMRKGILQAIHDLDEQIYEVTKLIVDQSEKESTAKQVNGQVKLYLLVEKECDVNLKLTYGMLAYVLSVSSVEHILLVVLAAMWEPIYDLHANISEDGKPSSRVMLHYRARITQSSGEDWKNASLTLSTATQNKQRVEVPKLPIYRLKYKSTTSTGASQGPFGNRQNQVSYATESMRQVSSPARMRPSPLSEAEPLPESVELPEPLVEAAPRAVVVPHFGLSFHLPPLSSSPKLNNFNLSLAQTTSFGQTPSQHTVFLGTSHTTSTEREDDPTFTESEDATVIRSSPLTTSYTVEGAFNVPSDGAAHTVSISNFNLEAVVTRVCIPRMNAEVMLQCKVQNTSDYRFLPGPVSIFLNDSFVTKTTLGEVVPKDHFECALGSDPSMRIRYKLSRVTSSGSRSMFGAKVRTVVCTAETIVGNKNGFAVSDLVVRDVLPIASEDSIKVELKKPEKLADTQGDKLIEVDDTTKVRWSKEADGKGGESEGKYEWLVTVGAGKTVTVKAQWEIKVPEPAWCEEVPENS
ncbi:hypothetical protein NM688_g7685 [Phlebia brevispora]|uniref:Uncharacterized protein n=1 Tax=Phlebia brevispora TaxID=194682 RepID=A0ACC1S2A1_9APHY|nr:hypothetical protein NM688_g7685 [Phlebia brevispora]